MDIVASTQNVTTNELRNNLIFILTVYIPLDFVIIGGNAFVLFVIRRTPSLQEPQFTLLASLALVDLLTGIIGVPMFMWGCILRGSLYLQNIDDCELQYIPMKIFVVTSFLHLLFITTDRYISIVKPLRYGQVVTRTRVYWAIAVSWVTGCWYGSVQLFWKSERIEPMFFCYRMNRRGITIQRYADLIMVPAAVILLIIMYFRIFREARKLRKCIKTQKTSVAPQKTVKKFKAAKTSGLIVCLFGVAYLPHSLRIVIFSLGIQRSDIYWYDLMAEIVLSMSSAINPFIYVFRHRQFVSVLNRLFRRNNNIKQQQKFNSGFSVNAI